MEVVINSCFGGFGLSYAATKAIMARKGMKCYGYASRGYDNDYTRFNGDGHPIYYCFTRDMGDSISRETMSDLFKSETVFTSSSFARDEKRTDPDLIAVVRELGEKANDSCAWLEIIEIPDDIPNGWLVTEYDGMEQVEEKHRVWN